MGNPDEIREKKLLIVEDESILFVELLKKIDIDKGIYVREVGGKGNFETNLSDLKKARNFDKLTHLGIIRDKDCDNAFESIVNILRRKMDIQNTPSQLGEFTRGKPQIGVFIMPGNTVEGNILEDLCLKSVEGQEAMGCVDEFANCFSQLSNPPSNKSKAKVLAYMACQKESVEKISRGAQKGYWNFESPCWNELKDFLKHMR